MNSPCREMMTARCAVKLGLNHIVQIRTTCLLRQGPLPAEPLTLSRRALISQGRAGRGRANLD